MVIGLTTVSIPFYALFQCFNERQVHLFMTTSFKKIERSTVTESIIDQIKEQILSGKLRPGEKLPPERVLAETLSVGRTSVREAIRALQYMGVLEVRCGEGTFLSENPSILADHFKSSYLIRKFSVMELVEARKIVEGATVYLATERATPEDRETLVELHDLAQKVSENEEEFLKADFEFHKKIAEMCQNSVLLEMLNATRELTLEENIDVIKKPGQIQNALSFHKDILEAILSCDAERARQRMLEHLENIENTVIELVEKRNLEGSDATAQL